jgi:uncharacterized alpha-E superfamily protein
MLSRVAQSLYWMARHVERAEAVSRVVAVHFQARLDGGPAGWGAVVRIVSDEDVCRVIEDEGGERAVLAYLLAHPDNPDGVLPCLGRARENARGVRDQVSSEMWEHLNRLYFLARDEGVAGLAQGPYAFFRRVRDGSQAFQGIANATMAHGEAYEFLQLGRYLERAATTLRIVRVRYAEVAALDEGSVAASLELMNLLKSCSAFEPFRRQPGSGLLPGPVAEYLLLDRQFPRAVLFCLARAADAVAAVAAPSQGRDRLDAPARLLGRLRADLAYLDIADVLGDGFHPLLDSMQSRLDQVGEEVTRVFFNTRVILPAARKAAAAAQQQQRQQQQSRVGS